MSQLSQAVYSLTKTTTDSQKLAEAIAAYLLDTRQTKNVGVLLRDLRGLKLDKDGVLEADVSSARPLSKETEASIKELFGAKKVIINQEQDPSLIGGVKVRAHDQQLDTSVRTRLQRLRNRSEE